MSKFKGTETVKNVMEKEVKMYKNAQNAKARESSKNLCNWAPACTLNPNSDAQIAGVRAK
jgi:hypothetical protein